MIGKNISFAAELLKVGRLVSIPTETVYGLAANALDPVAVAGIFSVKNRPSFDPLIIHVSSLEEARKYVLDIPLDAQILASEFWPGPLTMVFKKNPIIPDIVSAGLPTVAVRVPSHPLTRELLEELYFPVAAPSANPFGYVSPTSARHVDEQLGSKISYVLDGGNSEVGLESTIIDFSADEPKILRLGGLEKERIEGTLYKEVAIQTSSSNPKAPGMLSSHYSPKIPLFLGEVRRLVGLKDLNSFGIISFSTDYSDLNPSNQIILSKSGKVNEAAANLFGALREAEKWPVEGVIAETVPNEGLGLAINDRLSRAAYKPKKVQE